MSHIAVPLVPVPDHVPQELVVDWDFSKPPGGEADIVGAWKRLHDGPDIVWTPYNGGHWILTRAADIEFAQRNHDPFSMHEITLPASTTMQILPLSADPPEHADYRALINRFFAPKVIRDMEGEIRELAVLLIEGFKKKGRCEFMSDFAMKFPITIFMRLVNLPLTDLDDLLAWTEASVRANDPERREWSQRMLFGYLENIIRDRQKEPGADLISAIVNGTVFGRPLTEQEIRGMMVNVIFGGLDTVASTMGFAVLYLARNPAHRRQLAEHPELVGNAVEELLRMFAPSSTGRVMTRDFEYKGVRFKAGDRVYVRPLLHGMDERKFQCPMHADFARANASQHAAFGNGPHRCAGALLARNEIRVFLEEWFRRIPDFELDPAGQIGFEGGMVNCVTRVPLVWNSDVHQLSA
ncbi:MULTISPECIES: cytochrome P450 [Paraburkholderia]|uniref:Cytochrome P450 n=2 Tax=Paraburkholderia TaxID=1822464 RepID=A0ABU9SI89_9BURK